jgi:para-aminobenzoate synthetase component 1
MAPLVEELTPAPDPFETARRFAHLPHLLFLDSADRHSARGRYSFLSADPPVAYRFGPRRSSPIRLLN